MRHIIRGLFNASENINEVAPDVYQDGIDGVILTNSKHENWCFYKSHAAQELFEYQGNTVVNDLIIYIIRNPLDVFCSQLNYVLSGFSPDQDGSQFGCESIDEAKRTHLLDDYFSAFLVFGTLMPFFESARSWMQNTQYWVEKSRTQNNVIVVKYEDMINQLSLAMKPVLTYVGKTQADLFIAAKIANANSNDDGKFFWKKSEGTYREYLSKEQIERFVSTYSNSLKLSGYENYFINNEVFNTAPDLD